MIIKCAVARYLDYVFCTNSNEVLFYLYLYYRLLQAGNLKLNDFSHEENIGIMDTTLCCLITWLEGHSLAQTVFTNLYLHSPSSIQDKPLGTFCVAMLKLVDVIEECVTKYEIMYSLMYYR